MNEWLTLKATRFLTAQLSSTTRWQSQLSDKIVSLFSPLSKKKLGFFLLFFFFKQGVNSLNSNQDSFS